MCLVALCCEWQMRFSVVDIYKWPVLRDLALVLNKQTVPKKEVLSSNAPTITRPLPAPFSMLGTWKQHSSVLSAVREQLHDVEVRGIYPMQNFLGSLRRRFFTFASNAVSQNRRSAQALLTLASPSTRGCSATFLHSHSSDQL